MGVVDPDPGPPSGSGSGYLFFDYDFYSSLIMIYTIVYLILLTPKFGKGIFQIIKALEKA